MVDLSAPSRCRDACGRNGYRDRSAGRFRCINSKSALALGRAEYRDDASGLAHNTSGTGSRGEHCWIPAPSSDDRLGRRSANGWHALNVANWRPSCRSAAGERSRSSSEQWQTLPLLMYAEVARHGSRTGMALAIVAQIGSGFRIV
jgi:hypothetical protein